MTRPIDALFADLQRIGIEGLGFDPDVGNHFIQWDDNDILWMNTYGSYTRRAECDYKDDAAYRLLRRIKEYCDQRRAKRDWDVNNPDDMEVAVKAYKAARSN